MSVRTRASGGGGSPLHDYETQTGDIAAPVTVALGNGHVVILYNSTKARYFICTYANVGWRMVEVL